MKILVVTNSQIVLALIGLIVEEVKGKTIVGWAATVGEALESMKRHHPEVVIVDMQTANDDPGDLLEQVCPGTKDSMVVALCDKSWEMAKAQDMPACVAIPWSALVRKLPWILERMDQRNARETGGPAYRSSTDSDWRGQHA